VVEDTIENDLNDDYFCFFSEYLSVLLDFFTLQDKNNIRTLSENIKLQDKNNIRTLKLQDKNKYTYIV